MNPGRNDHVADSPHSTLHSPTVRSSPLAIVLPSLIGGGAERVAIELANHWSDQGRQVFLVTIDELRESRYPIRPRVHSVGLNLKRTSHSAWSAARNNLARVRGLRRALHSTSATTVVSFTDITNVTTLLACRRSG